MSSTKRRSVGLVLAFLGVACSGDVRVPDDDGTRWIELARGAHPVLPAGSDPLRVELRGRSYRVVDRPGRDDWREHGHGIWSVLRPIPRDLREASPGHEAVTARVEGEIVRAHPSQRMRAQLERWASKPDAGSPPPATLLELDRPCLLAGRERVFLILEPGAGAPDAVRLTSRIDLGSSVDGRWRLRHLERSSDAVVIWSDGRYERQLELPDDAVLHFEAVAFGADLEVGVRWNGDEIAAFDVRPGDPRRHRLALPSAGGESRLRVEVRGEPGLLALLNPIVGPVRDPGAPEERAGRDVVLLMADTFRADNLAAWGGDPRIAPGINAFAATARRYLNARAPATWTLPSHASLFTGRYPPEIGMLEHDARLAGEAHTLAERLRDAGYRTVAITDSGFVSADFGLDQGFERFEEIGSMGVDCLADTLDAVARALEGDDGRPLFLFVQSYRAHSWTVSDRTRDRLGDDYVFRPEIHETAEFRASLIELLLAATHGEPMAGPEYEELVLRMIPNYRGGSADAAEGFSRILDLLAARGLTDEAVIVFTSDHGEVFGEHGVIGHGNGVWEGQAVVPLLISAPGLPPTDDRTPASLVDLPRTLCSLVDVRPSAAWSGVDLTDPPAERTVFVFQARDGLARYVAAVEDEHKLVFADSEGPGDLRFAYRLDVDPGEARDLTGSVDGRLVDDLRRQLETVFRPLVGAERAEPPAHRERQLRELGYLSEGD